jgi:acetoacetyl-CoA synthetase
MEDIAASHIEAMRQIQANGPYAIIGFSFGGLSAYEMGRQLAAEGETVEQLVLLDAAIHPRFLPASVRVRLRLRQLGMVRRGLRGQNGRDALRYLRRQFGSVLRKLKLRLGRPLEKDFAAMLELPPLLKRVRSAGDVAFALYRPGRYPGRVLFLRATERPPREADSLQMWRRIAAEVDVQDIPSTHRGLVEEPAVGHVAVVLARRLGDGRVA